MSYRPTVTPVITLAVINPEGGSGKTTSAAFLASALDECGRRVLLIDADPQASVLLWHERSGFPFAVVGLPSGQLHHELPGVTGDRFDAVVIDTPPAERGRTIALSAARAATHVVVPVAPTPDEYERLPAVRTMLDEAAELPADGHPGPIVGVLLVRALTSAASRAACREVITADGWTALSPVISRREVYAQAFGEPIIRADVSPYGDVLSEMIGIPP
jgi:chromosome partitioning protein